MSWMLAATKQFIYVNRSSCVCCLFCRVYAIRLSNISHQVAWMKDSKISLINLREQGKSMSYTRMFRGKMRMSTCRIILITSLAWLLIDVIIIMKYTDGLGGGIFKKTPRNEVSELENWSLKHEPKSGSQKWKQTDSVGKKCINCSSHSK